MDQRDHLDYTSEKYLEASRELIGRKWPTNIIKILSRGSKSYTEIQEEIDISNKVLAKNLDDLQDYGLIDDRNESNRGTEYSLTETGERLNSQMRCITDIEVLLQGRSDWTSELEE